MNLYQKLIEVRKQIFYIQKSAQGYKFQYATEGHILAAIRPKMDELGVFLEAEMNSLEPVDVCICKDKTQVMLKGLKASFTFTWTNADTPEEKINKTILVQGVDSDITSVGGLLTYAHRYFLFKFFSVATDKLDPDAFENSVSKIIDSQDNPKQIEQKESNIHIDLMYQLIDLIGDRGTKFNGFEKEEDSKWASNLCIQLNVPSLDKIKESQVGQAFAWANRRIADRKEKQSKVAQV